VHLVDHDWVKWAVFLGRHCQLSAFAGVAASVVHEFGRNTNKFRVVASETVHDIAVSIG
jgi:hypothetical protein